MKPVDTQKRGDTRKPVDRVEALGTQPIGRVLFHACLQTTLSVGIYGIYTLTNAWFVARGVGEDALAAVSISAPVILLLGAVSTTVGVGGSSLVARHLGANRVDDAALAAGNAFAVFWTAALAMTLVGLFATGPLLRLLGASGETLKLAQPYTRVVMSGAVLSTGFSSIVRAEGRLRFATLLWVIPVLVHIALDPVLIYGFHLGVTGAALGTVGGQAISAGMSIWFFFVQRNRAYRISAADLKPRRRIVGSLLSIGAPSFLSGLGATLLVALINTSLSRRSNSAVAASVALAAFAVCARIQTFATMPQTGITQGLQPIVGYNHGRGSSERVIGVRSLALRWTLIYGVIAGLIVGLFAPALVRLFIDDPPTVDVAVTALRMFAAGLAFSGIAPLISAYFQAIGRAAPSYVISIGTLLAIKAPLVVMFASLAPNRIWAAIPMGEVLAAAAALLVLRTSDSDSTAPQ